jgi:hypothetical protein
MSSSDMYDPRLDRSERRLGRPAWMFLALAVVVAIPGVVLILAGNSWVRAIGIAVTAMACVPALVGIGLALGSLVAWWVAREKPFA